jgi:hypothetical protein
MMCKHAVLFAALLAVTGCTSLGTSQADFEKKHSPRPIARTRPTAAPVTPEQVTNDNAHQISQNLWDEMDRETTARTTSSAGTKRD